MNEHELIVKFPTHNKSENKTTIIVGQTGSGKTTLLANLLNGVNRFVAIDSQFELTNLPQVHLVGSMQAFLAALRNGSKRIVFVINEQQPTLLDTIAYVLREYQQLNYRLLGDVVFALDELGAFTTPNSWPKGLQLLVQRGRRAHIQKLFATQWYSRVPAFLRDSASEKYVFRQQDKVALQFLAQDGLDIDVIKSLNKLECVYHDGFQQTLIRLKSVGEMEIKQADDTA